MFSAVSMAAPLGVPQGITAIEHELIEVWQELLGVSGLGPEDSFFFHGGHSLLAVRSAIRIKERLDVEVPYRVIAKHPTVRELAAWIAEQARTRDTEEDGFPVWDRTRAAPLSPAQEQIWILQQLRPDSVSHHFQALVHFAGDLSETTLEQALDAVVERHEVFRLSVRLGADGYPVQRVHPHERYVLPVTDLSMVAPDVRETALRELTERLPATRFRLEYPPLVRWHLVKLTAGEYVLLHVAHRLIHDSWSFNVFLGELAQAYRQLAKGRPLPPVRSGTDFVDVAVRRYEQLESGALDGQLAYWRERFASPPAPLELPADRPRPQAPSFEGRALRITLAAELSGGLRAFARGRGVSLYLALFSGWLAWLNRLTGQSDLCVGGSLVDRTRPETERLIGMLANHLPIRIAVDAERGFGALLEAARATLMAAQEHPDVPFHKILLAPRFPHDVSRDAFFRVNFGLHEAPSASPALPGTRMSVTEGVSNGSAEFDMNVVVVSPPERSMGAPQGSQGSQGSQGESITLVWEYATDLFDAETVDRFAVRFQTLLGKLIEHPDTPLKEHDVTAEPLERIITALWADLLNRPELGADDDFFELGGDSRLALRTASRLSAELGLELPALEVLRHPTARELAARIDHLASALTP